MIMATRGCLFIAAICAGAILLTAATTSVEAQYSYTILSVPGASSTAAWGFDGSNVVGSCYNGTNYQGFLYNTNSNTYTTLSAPGAIDTYAGGISGNNIAGYYYDGTNNYGFLYNINSATFTTLTDPASPNIFVFGIDGANVVGEDEETSPQFAYGAFVSSGGQYFPLYVPAAQDAAAYGIDGTNIVGAYLNEDGLNLGFLYNGSSYTSLSVPGTAGTYAYGINGSNIVGIAWESIYGYDQGFVYNINSGAYTTFTVPESTSTVAQGIHGDEIVGNYTSTNGVTYGFLATPLPSPLTLHGAAVANEFHLTVSGPSAPATIEASTNLVNWVIVTTNTPPFTFTDSAMAMFPARFYRASLSQ